MKVTCEFCGGSGNVVTGGGSLVLKPCDRCNQTGRVESRPRHTSLTLACADCPDTASIRFSETPGGFMDVQIQDAAEVVGMYLDAEAEASLLRWLKAREEER